MELGCWFTLQKTYVNPEFKTKHFRSFLHWERTILGKLVCHLKHRICTIYFSKDLKFLHLLQCDCKYCTYNGKREWKKTLMRRVAIKTKYFLCYSGPVTAIVSEETAMNRTGSNLMEPSVLPGWLLTPSLSYLFNHFWNRMEHKTGPLCLWSILKQLWSGYCIYFSLLYLILTSTYADL